MDPRRRFRFLKELSEGAFGKVYMAEMITGENFRSIVAIKLLHGKWLGHEEIVQRSRDEARVLGLLHHRNIIRVEDLTSIHGQCAVVMEYLDGVDVKTLVNYCKERTERIPFKVAFEIIAAVASALEAAYNTAPLQGGQPLHLIHRDIKPSNVMVTKAGDVKVLDFGTAQANFDEREAHTQALAFGSAAYMAPERLLGDPDAPSGDVFSLGITLYEMLAQETFGKVHIRPEKYDRELDGRIDGIDLETLGDDRALQVRQVLRLLLAYESEDRPSAAQVVDLMEALADEVHDGSMRRFARSIVSPCRDQIKPVVNPDDPLTGSTLFEDRMSGARARAAAADSDERSVDDGETWVDDGAVSPFQVPPELAGVDGSSSLINEELVEDRGQAPQPVGGGTLAPPAEADGLAPLTSTVPDGVDPFVGLDSVAGAPSLDDLQPPAQNLAALPPTPPSGPVVGEAGGEADGDPATDSGDDHGAATTSASQDDVVPPAPILSHEPSIGQTEPAPPPVAHAAVPRDITPGVADKGHHANTAGASTAGASTAGASKGKGGKLVVALVAAAVVGLVVVGGGYFAASSMGLLGATDSSADGSSTTTGAGEPSPGGSASAHGVPGGTVEVGPMDETHGALALSLSPPGSGTVVLSSGTGFKQAWDGSGRLDLLGLDPGIFKTKVSPAGGHAIRGTVEVQPGKTCSYVLSTTQDDAEWTADGCE